MKALLTTARLFIVTLALCPVCFTQTDPNKVPQPPTSELKKFEPYLGKFDVSGEFAKTQWTGTVEIQRAVKSWYIEQTILVKTTGIDRELRLLTTLDKNAQKYRVWRFETAPVGSKNQGEVQFEGDEMIQEWISARPDGSQQIFRNRLKMTSKDELQILSEGQAANGSIARVGFLTGKRVSFSPASLVRPPNQQIATHRKSGEEIQQMIHKFAAARAKNDIATLDSLLSDDYIHTDYLGEVHNRAEWLDYVKERKAKGIVNRVEFEDVLIRIYGNVAVVTGRNIITEHN